MPFRHLVFAKTAALVTLLGACAAEAWGQTPPLTAPTATPAAPTPKAPPAAEPAGIAWAPSLDAALKQARASRKKVLVAVYAPWCGWCRVMQAKTYPHPEVIRLVNAHFVAVRLNAESRDTLSFLGERYPYSPDAGMNELALQLLNGRRSYPVTVFLSAQAEVLSPVRGYFNPTTFSKLLRYFGEDNYLYAAWPDYEKGAATSDSSKK